MTNELLSQISPSEGFSVVRKAMEDAIAFYLPMGGPALARQHVELLANSMSFYPDCTEAYRDAMAKISEAEKAEQQRQEERQQQLIIQLIGAAKSHKPHCEFGVLPAKLSTDKAMLMWQRLQQAGLIDDHYQPVNLSRTDLAILAFDISTFLGIREKWKIFETLWGKNNLRSDYNCALFQQKSMDFRDRLKLILKPAHEKIKKTKKTPSF
jgi:hypothetical protein